MMMSRRMEAGPAPMALRMPNSRVRSRTVTSMMLLTPTMPAMSVLMPTIQINIIRPPRIRSNMRKSSPVFHMPRAPVSEGSKWWRRAMAVRKRCSKAVFSSSDLMPRTVKIRSSTSIPLRKSCWAVVKGM